MSAAGGKGDVLVRQGRASPGLCSAARIAVLGSALLLAPGVSAALSQPAPSLAQPADAAMLGFVATLRPEATARGVSTATLEVATRGLTPDPEVLELAGSQLEHERTIQDYIALLVSPERIAAGRLKLAEQKAVLDRIEARFGVDRHIVVAIWGVETMFGTRTGERNVIRSLATLALADARRSAFWRSELIAALRILQTGDVAPERMLGSWAGAMGHTQFMPTTFLAHGVDLDGDGRRDIWGSPGDALASTANYLRASGWVAGSPWGFEVGLPRGFDFSHSAPGRSKPIAEWQALGLQRPAGEAWPAPKGDLQLVLPAGAGGPALLVTTNFRAILRYNASLAYALAVGQLADRLAGGPGIAAMWPLGQRALTRGEREELQGNLIRLGHETGGVDGVLGAATRNAIRAYQRGRGLPEDGYPSPDLLERLRQDRS